MKKIVGISFVLLSVGVLFACSDNTESDGSNSSGEESTSSNDNGETAENGIDEDNNSTNEGEQDGESGENSGSGLIDKDEINGDKENDESDEPEANLGEGETEDQLDLEIGDTAVIETTISKFEYTVKAIEIKDEIDSVRPDLDIFVVSDISIKNVSDEVINIEDAIGIFEVTTDLNGGGYGDVSQYYDVGIESIEGELQPDETFEGQLLYEDQSNAEHYIRVKSGLVSSSSVKNQAIWTFDE